ncbi:MAG: putative protease sohB, partial [Pseudomonadota bacterium]|jgi:signal peptide peptidase SppA
MTTINDDNAPNKKQPDSKIDGFLTKLCDKIPCLKCFGSAPVVAVLHLHGVIGSGGYMKSGLSFDNLDEQITKAFKIAKLKAVVLSINSPGGSPVQSELIYKRIRQLSIEKNIKVLAFVQDVAASGGYFLSLAADEIFVSANSIVGSIGVISSGFGFQETIKKLGIERRVYTQGKNKSVLDPFSPEKSSDVEIIKNIQSDIHQSFKDLVTERRGEKLDVDTDLLFSGEFWSGKKALELGLVDGIGNMHEVIELRFGRDIVYRKMTGQSSWLKRKLGISVQGMGQDLVSAASDKLEEKLLWNRFGL